MRLIDADELKKDDEVTQWLSLNAVRTGKMLKMFSELFVKKIDDAPTVQAIPIEVLQEIRQEIEQELQDYSQYAKDGEDYYLGICTGCDDALAIIDKHIKEIEE